MTFAAILLFGALRIGARRRRDQRQFQKEAQLFEFIHRWESRFDELTQRAERARRTVRELIDDNDVEFPAGCSEEQMESIDLICVLATRLTKQFDDLQRRVARAGSSDDKLDVFEEGLDALSVTIDPGQQPDAAVFGDQFSGRYNFEGRETLDRFEERLEEVEAILERVNSPFPEKGEDVRRATLSEK